MSSIHSIDIQKENELLIAELHRLQEEYEHVIDLLDEHAFKLTEANCETAATKAHVHHKPSLLKKIADFLKLSKHQLHYDILMSGLFDEVWYLQTNPDVERSSINPITHYLKFGAKEGRNPGPYFHSHWYLRTYPDVLAKGINPLVHYMYHGKKEGRHPQQNPRLFSNPTDTRIRWLTDSLAELKVAHAKLESQFTDAHQQLSLANEERRINAAHSESIIVATQNQLSQVNAQLELANEERRLNATQYESQFNQMQSQLSQVNAQLELANEERRLNATQYESQIGILQSQVSNLHRQLDTAHEDRRNTSLKLTEEITILKAQVEQAGAQLESFQNGHSNAVAGYEFKIGELNLQLSDALKMIQNFEVHATKLDAETNTNRLFLQNQLQALKMALVE